MIGASWIVLEIGKRRLDTKGVVDEEDVFAAVRRGDALLLEWSREVDDLHPPEEAAEELLAATGDLLQVHRDPRGVLVIPIRGLETPNGSYAEIVAKYASTGRWIPSLANEPGVNPARDMREEIPLPDVPRSRKAEIFVMSNPRAMETFKLERAPLRVVCMDRISQLAPKEVSGFYLPHLRRLGLKAKRRVWSDGSTEQLVAATETGPLIVHAEETDEGTFVRVAAILQR
jgi:hypothetical protein